MYGGYLLLQLYLITFLITLIIPPQRLITPPVGLHSAEMSLPPPLKIGLFILPNITPVDLDFFSEITNSL